MKKPSNPKERNLVTGAIRRVFSRSELRKRVLEKSVIRGHTDPTRSRVTKWSKCAICLKLEPTYMIQVDHKSPVVPVGVAQSEMTWDEVIDNIWCDESNLQPLCKPCHAVKSAEENKLRRQTKKGKAK